MITHTCPACKTIMQIPDHLAGHSGYCTHCNTPITAPGGFKKRKRLPFLLLYIPLLLIGLFVGSAALAAALGYRPEPTTSHQPPTTFSVPPVVDSPPATNHQPPTTALAPAPHFRPEPSYYKTPGNIPSAEPPAQQITVYTTNTGKKYHRANCQYLRQSSIPLSLTAAQSRNLTPCSKCQPPTSQPALRSLPGPVTKTSPPANPDPLELLPFRTTQTQAA